ncbi:MAG: hypothetical protein K0U41_06540 [Gammaproteobacteria bacterium]|nr:hypothetical protein [Gammaproteobacteria bacterium]
MSINQALLLWFIVSALLMGFAFYTTYKFITFWYETGSFWAAYPLYWQWLIPGI